MRGGAGRSAVPKKGTTDPPTRPRPGFSEHRGTDGFRGAGRAERGARPGPAVPFLGAAGAGGRSGGVSAVRRAPTPGVHTAAGTPPPPPPPPPPRAGRRAPSRVRVPPPPRPPPPPPAPPPPL